MAEIEVKDQKNMIAVGIVAAVLIIYSAFFAHQLPYEITQYLGYSVVKMILFAIIAVITYASPVLGIVLLIAVLSTFQYFYMQKAFRRNFDDVKRAGKRALDKTKKEATKLKEKVEDAVDDDDKKEEEVKEAMCSASNNYYLAPEYNEGFNQMQNKQKQNNQMYQQNQQQGLYQQKQGLYQQQQGLYQQTAINQAMNNRQMAMNLPMNQGVNQPMDQPINQGLGLGLGLGMGQNNRMGGCQTANSSNYPSFVNEINPSNYESQNYQGYDNSNQY